MISNARYEALLVSDTTESGTAAWQWPDGHPWITLFRVLDVRSTTPEAVSTEAMQTFSGLLRR